MARGESPTFYDLPDILPPFGWTGLSFGLISLFRLAARLVDGTVILVQEEGERAGAVAMTLKRAASMTPERRTEIAQRP